MPIGGDLKGGHCIVLCCGPVASLAPLDISARVLESKGGAFAVTDFATGEFCTPLLFHAFAVLPPGAIVCAVPKAVLRGQLGAAGMGAASGCPVKRGTQNRKV